MEKKPCLLTTYVAGEKYQAFIPLLVFSCKRAYPEYDVMLFLHESLQPEIKDCLLKNELLDIVIIKENVFKDECPKPTRLQAQSFRWVLWDEVFRDYKYLYIVDIDMFYIREPMPLHVQHSERMKKTGLPFDNMRRLINNHKNIKNLVHRLQCCGLHNMSHYLFDSKVAEERITGLHFVEVERYYSNDNLLTIKGVKQGLLKKYFFPEILTSNDEVLLANMVKQMGYDTSKLGIQTDSVNSLSFNDIYRKEFRPHHGFHLGIFRGGDVENKYIHYAAILQSDTYKYYLNQYLSIIQEGSFKEMYKNLPSLAKTYVDRLHAYYQIVFNYE